MWNTNELRALTGKKIRFFRFIYGPSFDPHKDSCTHGKSVITEYPNPFWSSAVDSYEDLTVRGICEHWKSK